MITILDGGMGGEIQDRVPNAKHGLWSATALIECPQLVTDIHQEYIDAGADVITTNTYSTVPSYLGKVDMAERYLELTASAAQLARQAADASDRPVRVAGALPPLEESYRPDLVPPPAEAQPIYEAMTAAMAAKVDFFLCETMSTAAEAYTAAHAALTRGGGKPVYVSWTLDETPGSGLRSGETIAAALAELADLNIAGFLFNCTHPEAIEAGLAELRTLTRKPIGCYPNRLNRVPESWTLDNTLVTGLRQDLPTTAYVMSIQRCVDLGATIVGGCCGIRPKDIQALADTLAATATD